MQMIVEYPDLLPDAMRMSRSEFEREARMAMAVKLFEMGKLSSGYAAQLAGIERVDFILALSKYGVAYLNYPPEELEQDIGNWSRILPMPSASALITNTGPLLGLYAAVGSLQPLRVLFPRVNTSIATTACWPPTRRCARRSPPWRHTPWHRRPNRNQR